jgi:hypothetical protein
MKLIHDSLFRSHPVLPRRDLAPVPGLCSQAGDRKVPA